MPGEFARDGTSPPGAAHQADAATSPDGRTDAAAWRKAGAFGCPRRAEGGTLVAARRSSRWRSCC